jgi:hypothetical protein
MGTGYLIMDVLAVVALGAVIAFGVIRHRRWRKSHPLPPGPDDK